MAENLVPNRNLNAFQEMNQQFPLDNNFEDNSQYGPLELNILERVENGLDENNEIDINDNMNQDKSDNEKYDG